MKFNSFSPLVGLVAMSRTVSAHMIMAQPVPFGSPNNSPLSPDGSDYPCKIGGSGSYDVKTMNQWKVGEKQTLSFTGSAVHGGGSCQISVSLDKNPTKSSKFKVIHSIEGGCPGVNTGSASTFSFEVPKELPNGQYAMSWTWFNHIGNREIYQNCAPIEVTGGSNDQSGFDALPDMALANIAVGEGATCKTTEGKDYTFKNPGKSVQRVGSGPFVDLCGGAASGGGAGGNLPSQGAPSGAPTQTQNPGMYTPPASQGTAAPSQGPSVTSQAPASSPQSSAITSTIHTLVTVTAPSSKQTPTASAPASAAQPSAAPSTGAGGSGTCTGDGAIICNGENQFGICDHGKVVWQSVAAGTKCQNGTIQKRDFTHRAQRTVI